MNAYMHKTHSLENNDCSTLRIIEWSCALRVPSTHVMILILFGNKNDLSSDTVSAEEKSHLSTHVALR